MFSLLGYLVLVLRTEEKYKATEVVDRQALKERGNALGKRTPTYCSAYEVLPICCIIDIATKES
jgi:hypothetical protein